MHKKEIATDLKLCRKLSGLSGYDVAHLLGVTPARVSRLECAKKSPSSYELSLLAMIYGNECLSSFRSSERYIAAILKDRLASIPNEPENWKAHDARLDTLNILTSRVRDSTKT